VEVAAPAESTVPVGVHIRGLAKRFPATTDLFTILRHPLTHDDGTTALRGIDLELLPGRIYGLVGPNGAGKTTLLKIIAGLVLPSEGTLQLDGLAIDARDQRVRDTIGYVVSEERSFNWRLDVRENLRFFAALEKVERRDERVAWCLERVGLTDVASRPYRELSTGMRQRLALARGLLANPRILLMDEATRSLDPLAAEELRLLLAELFTPESGRTLVYATHQLAEVEDLCTDLVVLRGGRVTAQRIVGADAGGCHTLRTRTAVPDDVLELDGIEVVRKRDRVVSVRAVDGDALDRLLDRIRDAKLGLIELRPDPWIEDLLKEEVQP
jgi:ABC-2 type transport system ATP-binding protein